MIEQLDGKPAEEYWNSVSDLAGHFKDHADDFWRQITREEYTAIGLEVIEQNKSNLIRYIHEGEPRFGFYDAASNIFVATNRDANLKVHTIFKPRGGKDYLQTLVFDLE